MIDDLRAMTIYVRTVELGSFRAAAEALNLSPSVVSYHISKLEKKYGVALLYRSTRKLSQTNEGETFYAHARKMVTSAQDALDLLRGSSVNPAGKLTISIPAGFVRGHYTWKIAQFASLYPKVNLSLIFTDERINLISQGVDISLRVGAMPDSSLKSRRLDTIQRKLVCSPDYLKGRTRPTNPAGLSNWDWISLKMMPHHKDFTNDAGETCQVDYMPRIEVNNIDAMYKLTCHGLGLSSPPDFLVDDDIRAGRLVHLMMDWHLVEMKTYAVWPTNVAAGSLTSLFLDFLKSSQAQIVKDISETPCE